MIMVMNRNEPNRNMKTMMYELGEYSSEHLILKFLMSKQIGIK